jgi:hypothetical protein
MPRHALAERGAKFRSLHDRGAFRETANHDAFQTSGLCEVPPSSAALLEHHLFYRCRAPLRFYTAKTQSRHWRNTRSENRSNLHGMHAVSPRIGRPRVSARRTAKLAQEPPRRRWRLQSPVIHADPSTGAPL